MDLRSGSKPVHMSGGIEGLNVFTHQIYPSQVVGKYSETLIHLF